MLLFDAESLLSLECINIYSDEVVYGVMCIIRHPGMKSTISGEHTTIESNNKIQWKALLDER